MRIPMMGMMSGQLVLMRTLPSSFFNVPGFEKFLKAELEKEEIFQEELKWFYGV
ncbi:MAG: hypothetical protein ACOWWR_04295 [Eubacteriales bacterium]